jgi:glutamate carboxypeptidase
MIPTSAFSADALLAELLDWVRIESPTYDAAAVNRMEDFIAPRIAALGFAIERVPGRDSCGDILRCRRAGSSNQPGVLMIAHADTVHPVGTLAEKLPIRREGDKCFGPAIYDMKGGTVIALAALKAVLEAGKLKLPMTIVINPDEEIGSPTSRALIEAEGRPAHSGWTNTDGRSAVRVMAQIVEELESRSDFDKGPTYAVSVFNGGQWVNCVPMTCTAPALCVAREMETFAEIGRVMDGLVGVRSDVRIEVQRGPVRPLWTAHAATMGLYERAKRIAGEIGFDLPHGQHGDGSDGNFTGAMGVATLDGLGVRGAGAHTHEEHILVSSLVPRATLMARLLAELD